MPPYLLLYPAFDHSETNTRMADPKVVHPTAQNQIDFRNHGLDGPADVLSEDLPEPFKQRYGGHDLHFITCSCYRRRPELDSGERRDLFLRVLERTRQKYRFVVIGYVVKPDHFHLLITEPEVRNPSV